MLEYNHYFNTTDLSKPFHIHQLLSSVDRVATYINDSYIGEVRPNGWDKNTTQGYTFTKYLELTNKLMFDLLVSGSAATYDRKINEAIFNDKALVYISSPSGKRLYKNPDTNKYSWSEVKRSRFFYNPYYFDSGFLWALRFGSLPTGIKCSNQWPEIEKTIFLGSTFKYNSEWSGEIDLPMIEPMTISYYNRDTTGYATELRIKELLDIPHVVDGDKIRFDNGKEELEVVVENSGEPIFLFNETTVMDRPIVHVPIQCSNPNKLYHYAKGLESGTQEIISLELNNKTIQFKIVRT